jgi:CelD/BcsL family acetyltransferase involved in cellulose biosynthesis
VRVEVVDSVEALDALAPEWRAAADASVDPNIFLTFEWLRTWWQHFGGDGSGSRLHVVVVRDDEGIVLLAPLYEDTRGVGPLRATTLRQVGYDAGDYGGLIVVRRVDEAVDALLGHLAGAVRGRTGSVVLSRLPSDSVALRALRAGLARSPGQGLVGTEVVPPDAVCPYIDVSDGYDLVKPLRKNRVPQRLKRMGEKHEVVFTYHSGPTLEQGIDWLVELHERRWEDRADEFQGLLADPEAAAFLVDAVRAIDAADAGWLRLLTLTADGKPAAVRLDFDFGRRVYMLKNAIDPAFNEFGPGHITHARVLEDGMARGMTEFDFLRGDHPYKRRWSNGERHLVALTLTRPGPLGKLAHERSRVLGRLARS